MINKKIFALIIVAISLASIASAEYTMTATNSLILNAGENQISAMVANDGYILAAINSTPGKVIKAREYDLKRLSTLTFNSGEDYITDIAYYNGYAYAITYTSPAEVIKFDPITMTRTSSLLLGLGENFATSIIIIGSNAYVGLRTSPAKLVKINLLTFTKTATLTLNTGENKCESLDTEYGLIQMALYTNPLRITNVSIATFTRVNYSEYAGSEIYSENIAYDESNHVYVGMKIAPARINQYNNSTGVLIQDFILASGYDFCDSLVYDDGYVFAGIRTNPATIFKIAIETPAYVPLVETGNNIATGKDYAILEAWISGLGAYSGNVYFKYGTTANFTYQTVGQRINSDGTTKLRISDLEHNSTYYYCAYLTVGNTTYNGTLETFTTEIEGNYTGYRYYNRFWDNPLSTTTHVFRRIFGDMFFPIFMLFIILGVYMQNHQSEAAISVLLVMVASMIPTWMFGNSTITTIIKYGIGGSFAYLYIRYWRGRKQ